MFYANFGILCAVCQTICKTLFGTRLFVGINGNNPHQTLNLYLLLKICLVLEYWASLIPAYLQFSLNFSVFFLIPNTLPLLSGLCVGFVEIR
jgi:hypothetical protein